MIDLFFFAPDISIGRGESEGKSGTQMREKKGQVFLFESKPSGLIENQQADNSMCMDDWLRDLVSPCLGWLTG